MSETTWRIYGIRHVNDANRTRGQNYLLVGTPLVLNFNCWVLVSDDRAIILDTGMHLQLSRRRTIPDRRSWLTCRRIEADVQGISTCSAPAISSGGSSAIRGVRARSRRA